MRLGRYPVSLTSGRLMLKMYSDFLMGFIFGLVFIPFVKKLWSIYLWSIPEWGIIEEPWKTEFEEKVDSMTKKLSKNLERALYYGEN
jgi:hypothetical protein